MALAGGAWFVLGSEFSRLWTTPPPDGTGSDWMVIATNLGYHEGLGLMIVALSAFALGLLALLPERERTGGAAADRSAPVLDHEPERAYEEDETVVTTR